MQSTTVLFFFFSILTLYSTNSYYSTGKSLDIVSALTVSSIFHSNSLEFIASYERGHAMNKVATGVQNGEQIMNLFGGLRKKRIFLLLPNPGLWRILC